MGIYNSNKLTTKFVQEYIKGRLWDWHIFPRRENDTPVQGSVWLLHRDLMYSEVYLRINHIFFFYIFY